jgi:hypothetical protein
MSIKLKLLLIAICFAPGLTYSQNRNSGFDPSNKNGGPESYTSGKTKSDQKKDTIVFKMKVFQFSDGYSRLKDAILDTSFVDYQTYNPLFKQTFTAQNLGNLGASAQSNDFFDRSFNPSEFQFFRNHKYYGKWPKDVHFYNTTKPFTLLEYGQWFNNKPMGESWLNVLHTQNIRPSLNVGFSYSSISSQGKYLNQEARDNNLAFFASYNIDRYDLWFTIGKNKFKNQENGGLVDPSEIKNPDLKPEDLLFWLDGTWVESKNAYGIIAHQYKFGKWVMKQEKNEEFQKFIARFALMHTFEFSDNSRYFEEVDPNPYNKVGTVDVYFYGKDHNPYIKGIKGTVALPSTQDRSGMKRITNVFYLKAVEAPDRKYTFGKQAYIGTDLINVYFPREQLIYTPGIMQPPLGLTQSDKLINTFIGGSVFRSEGKFWNWNATGRYYIQGYRFADFDVSGQIEKPIHSSRDTSFIRINASMTNTTPDYFYSHYYSNHFKWENSFSKTYEFKIGAVYENPFRKFKLGFKYSIITNFIYWNEQSLPAQANSEFSVAQIFVSKDFKTGILNIQNSVLFQKSTTNLYMHVPQISTRNTIYLEGLYAKVLKYQFGFDLRYDTEYYADYYSPALGMFYVQNKEKIGDFPWLDAFVNLKIKRTRFYVKYSNIGSKILKNGYFTSPTYPAQPATASFGLSWTFYD